MGNIEQKTEQKAIKLLKEDPCISLNEVSRQTGISSKRLSEIVKEEKIERLTRKQYVENYLKEHPYYTYAIIEEVVHYGQGNIARLAKKCGLSRDPHEMVQKMKDEICTLFENDENFDRNVIVDKYGVALEEVNEIAEAYREKKEKENRVSHKERVLELLKTTNLDYTNIANIVGCDLGYVSRLAKINDLQRNCSFAKALENNINYYLDNNPELSYDEIRSRLNRCPIDKVIKIAESKGINRNIVANEDEIVSDLRNNKTYAEISEKYDYNLNTIEKIAIKNGFLKRDKDKDEQVINILRERTTCTYMEISNLLNYNYSLVKAVAEENGFVRTTIDYGGKSKQEIIELLEKNPKMTYKEIGKKVNRSQHTVWRIAKENNLGHNKKNKTK